LLIYVTKTLQERADDTSDPKSVLIAVLTTVMLRVSCFHRANKKRTRAQATGTEDSDAVPAFEEDQEIERLGMLSSPIKGSKRITSEVRSLRLFFTPSAVLTQL
jgi:hypothetical protein